MFILDGATITSPSDLRAAAECEYALLRTYDVKLGRLPRPDVVDDAMLRRVAELGDAHEMAVLRELRQRSPVVEIPRPASTREGLASGRAATLAALRSDADVVFQGVFYDGDFAGYADFLIREGDGWTVADTKLARSTKVPALLQISAYASMLQDAGIPTNPTARLILGDRTEHDYPLADLLGVYRERRRRLDELLAMHRAEPGPAQWGDPRITACSRCAECDAAIEATGDVLLVHGVRVDQRKKLARAGVATIADLASFAGAVPDLSPATFARLQAQARLQLAPTEDGALAYEVYDPSALSVLPNPSAGDIFFDFEGDPMWVAPGDTEWGLEYLFGLVEAPVGDAAPAFRAFWAHDRAQEKQALIDFLAYVRQRRAQYPNLHIYHYAAYERSALLRLAARHRVGEEEVDQLLREGVLVDLYAVVKSAIRVAQRSYSIKKLEPLYMGDKLRDGIASGGDSIVVYHEYAQAVSDDRRDAAAELIESIRDYNEYDCLSTLGLRDWLLARAGEAGVATGRRAGAGPVATSPETDAQRDSRETLDRIEAALLESVPDDRGARDADQQALAMLAATVRFNKREAKPFWWAHFDRLVNPVDEWARGSEVFHVEQAEVVAPQVNSDLPGGWVQEGSRLPRRTLRLTGRFGSGKPLSATKAAYALYSAPGPEGVEVEPGHARAAIKSMTVDAVTRGAADQPDVVIVTEALKKGQPLHEELPLALTPDAGPMAASVDGALAELASRVLEQGLFAQPGLDLLRRLPPRLVGGEALPEVGDGDGRYVSAVLAAVRALDHSYLGVQGPPGTGKTYVAAHVIATLVREHHWKVGVVSQSHAAVENVLEGVVAAGLDPDLVGKQPQDPEGGHAYTAVATSKLAAFAADRAGSGYVIGGTGWTFTNTKQVDRDQLDLLVVDEAGQYSLAWTLACSVSANRLLLLGDPQQLPQVSQGTHPEPVETSALAWLLGDEPVMPTDSGYFLADTWRMHPALTERVSRLSYAGSLTSHEAVTAARSLESIEPGLHVVRVTHRDNTQSSTEEAQEVVRLAQDLIGRRWDDPDDDEPSRLITAADLCVVTPFNAQAVLLRTELERAGLGDVPVGTVDKFQGQEAPVAILSLATSAPAEVTRGTDFLLDRNRLNVSVSRGKWAAFVVRSDVLTDFSPRNPAELLAMGAFIGLCEGGHPWDVD